MGIVGAGPQGVGYAGQLGIDDDSSQFNATQFIIQQALGRVRTVHPVKVIGTSNAGAVSPPGTVNVQMLVNQIDGIGNTVSHGTIFNVIVWRYQGGADAIILDPVVGDFGFCGFCDRDISSVKAAALTASRGPANPGSRRRFDPADGIYLGGILNVSPTTYIQFIGGAINIVSPVAVSITTPTLTVNGDLVVTGDVTAAGISLDHHVHSGVQAGGADTGPPVS